MSETNNAYLTIARRAIRATRRPMTPTEILDYAAVNDIMPQHLHGDTKHKTLQARLSEEIKEGGGQSEFFRTAPATFFLHDLAQSDEVPAQFKIAFKGNPRSKTIRKENILVADREGLKKLIDGDFIKFDETAFQRMYRNLCFYADRAKAEFDEKLKQFVTFTIVHHGTKILVYRRGKFTTTSDELKGQMSVGFGGHVNDKDFDLFNQGADGFKSNAARELREELYFDGIYQGIDEAAQRATILGYINVDSSKDAQHHIAVLIAFAHKTDELPKKGELSINQITWHDLRNRYNDISNFDHWSQIILRHLYQGQIELSN